MSPIRLIDALIGIVAVIAVISLAATSANVIARGLADLAAELRTLNQEEPR